jgi:hypothetical protein
MLQKVVHIITTGIHKRLKLLDQTKFRTFALPCLYQLTLEQCFLYNQKQLTAYHVSDTSVIVIRPNVQAVLVRQSYEYHTFFDEPP